MNVKSCLMCNKLYKPRGYPFCQDCMDKIDDDYITVRDYLYKEPGAGMQKVIENTDIDEKRLFYLVRSGRVTFERDTSGIYCETCGKAIMTGNLCNDCLGKLSDAMKGKKPGRQPPSNEPNKPLTSKKQGIRMHITNRLNNK